MRSTRRPIHNYPVVPEESRQHKDKADPPVTREDLGADFRNAFSPAIIGLDWTTPNPICRQIMVEAKLGSVIWNPWYGVGETRAARKDPSQKGKPNPAAQEPLETLAANGVYIHALNSMSYSEISKPLHDRMRKLFGRRWMGHNEGEWDGAYISHVGSEAEGFKLPPGRSREEACRHYLDWMRANYACHHNYMVTISSLGFGCHYAAELGTRMVGLETGECLPSDTVEMAFCRGASKQYDLLMAITPSVFSMRGAHGFKCYPREGRPQYSLMDGYLAGPEHGSTLGLIKRLWWIDYMNGASIIGVQCGQFPCEGGSEIGGQGALPIEGEASMVKVMAHFTPLGWLNWECIEAAKRHPFRGVPYIPVAVMLPFDHGWYPQPTWYSSDKTNCVWGNIPYNAGDDQIDRFFQMVYPFYKTANWCAPRVDKGIGINGTRDERGKVTNTPFGDSFDVILSNAGAACLSKYQTVILLGEFDEFSRKGLAERLEAFVRDGGMVVTDINQWPLLPKEHAKGKVRARNAGGSPLVTAYACGEGEILVVGEPNWGTAADAAVFETVWQTVAESLQPLQLLEIEGRPIYYLVNVTDQPNELLVTLCNNSQSLSWEGLVRVRGEKIAEMEEWLACGEADIVDGVLRCGVPANDARVFRIRTRKPFLNLRFENVPWRKLGFGVPEWPEKKPGS